MLFVGTKKQSQEPIENAANGCGMPYVNFRWLGGMLTNFQTVHSRVAKLREFQRQVDSGEVDLMSKKEGLKVRRDLAKLERNLGGIKNLEKLPSAVFIIDTKKEHIAVTEANRLRIPVVAIVDTNCDPDIIDYVIPGNDDAIRSAQLMCRVISDAVVEGREIARRRGARAGTRSGGGRPGAPRAAAHARGAGRVRPPPGRGARRRGREAARDRRARPPGQGGAEVGAPATTRPPPGRRSIHPPSAVATAGGAAEPPCRRGRRRTRADPMADISAKDVAALRKMTGAGMMDCKKALLENDGDFERAKDWLREKGIAGAAKRSGRAADQGAIEVLVTDDVAAVVELNCETDFVAKGDGFGQALAALTKLVVDEGDTDLGSKKINGETVDDYVKGLSGTLGEKIEIGRVFRFETTDGLLDGYKHLQNDRGTVGVIIELGGVDRNDAKARAVAHDIALRPRPRQRARRPVGLRAVADRPQVGVHPHGGHVVRRRAAQPRDEARGVGLAELGRHRDRRGAALEARAEQRDRGLARRAELVPDEVAAQADPGRRRARAHRAVHRAQPPPGAG